MFARCCFLLALTALPLTAVVVDYPWPDSAPRSERYAVSLSQDGVTTPVTAHFSAPNLRQGEDGDGVTGVLEDRSLTYAPFAFTGTVEVTVTKLYGEPADHVVVSPKAFGLAPHFFDGRTVRFMLSPQPDQPEYVSVDFVTADNRDPDGAGGFDVKHACLLFGDAPETDVPDPAAPGVVTYSTTVDDATLAAADIIVFPPGDHDLAVRYPTNPRKASLPFGHDGQAVYAAGGAFIRGALHRNGHDHLKVYGRGIFTGVDLAWHEIRDASGNKDAFMDFQGASDGLYEGVSVVNPTHHTWPSGQRNTYRNVKVIGWASNHDGLRPSGGSLIEEVFIKTSDDYDYARDEHTARNSVIWPMRNGAFGQLGWNNLGVGLTTYSHLFFIHPEWHAYNRNRGVIGSVLEQGVNQRGNVVEDLYGEDFLSLLANITIEYEAGKPWDPADPGELRDFTFRNIILENTFRAASGEIVRNPLRGFQRDGATAMLRNFRFINVVAGDRLITAANAADYFDIDPATTENITFTTEGAIHTVTATAGPGGSVSPAGALPTPAGMRRAISITPDPGQRIRNVFVNGVPLGPVPLYTFFEVDRDHTLRVEFESGPATWNLTDADGDRAMAGYDPDDHNAGTPFLDPRRGLVASLDAPRHLDVTPAGPGQLRLTWDTVPGAEGYTLQRAAPDADAWLTVADLGAVATTYLDVGLGPAAPHRYRLRARLGDAGSAWSASPSVSPSAGAATATHLANFSCRLEVAAGETVIPGFVLAGEGPTEVLIRAVGPTLADYHIGGAMPDPRFILFENGTELAANDDWDPAAPALAAATARVGAFELAPAGADAALLATLYPRRNYSVHVRGAATGGIVLLEVYRVPPPGETTAGAWLANGSILARSGPGERVLILGFVLSGDTQVPLLIRGIGPTLADFDVPGALPHPALRLFHGLDLRLTRTGWSAPDGLDAVFSRTGAFPLSPDTGDSVLYTPLVPGAYSVHAPDAGGATGRALIELYEAPE